MLLVLTSLPSSPIRVRFSNNTDTECRHFSINFGVLDFEPFSFFSPSLPSPFFIYSPGDFFSFYLETSPDIYKKNRKNEKKQKKRRKLVRTCRKWKDKKIIFPSLPSSPFKRFGRATSSTTTTTKKFFYFSVLKN